MRQNSVLWYLTEFCIPMWNQFKFGNFFFTPDRTLQIYVERDSILHINKTPLIYVVSDEFFHIYVRPDTIYMFTRNSTCRILHIRIELCIVCYMVPDRILHLYNTSTVDGRIPYFCTCLIFCKPVCKT